MLIFINWTTRDVIWESYDTNIKCVLVYISSGAFLFVSAHVLTSRQSS